MVLLRVGVAEDGGHELLKSLVICFSEFQVVPVGIPRKSRF